MLRCALVLAVAAGASAGGISGGYTSLPKFNPSSYNKNTPLGHSPASHVRFLFSQNEQIPNKVNLQRNLNLGGAFSSCRINECAAAPCSTAGTTAGLCSNVPSFTGVTYDPCSGEIVGITGRGPTVGCGGNTYGYASLDYSPAFGSATLHASATQGQLIASWTSLKAPNGDVVTGRGTAGSQRNSACTLSAAFAFDTSAVHPSDLAQLDNNTFIASDSNGKVFVFGRDGRIIVAYVPTADPANAAFPVVKVMPFAARADRDITSLKSIAVTHDKSKAITCMSRSLSSNQASPVYRCAILDISNIMAPKLLAVKLVPYATGGSTTNQELMAMSTISGLRVLVAEKRNNANGQVVLKEVDFASGSNIVGTAFVEQTSLGNHNTHIASLGITVTYTRNIAFDGLATLGFFQIGGLSIVDANTAIITSDREWRQGGNQASAFANLVVLNLVTTLNGWDKSQVCPKARTYNLPQGSSGTIPVVHSVRLPSQDLAGVYNSFYAGNSDDVGGIGYNPSSFRDGSCAVGKQWRNGEQQPCNDAPGISGLAFDRCTGEVLTVSDRGPVDVAGGFARAGEFGYKNLVPAFGKVSLLKSAQNKLVAKVHGWTPLTSNTTKLNGLPNRPEDGPWSFNNAERRLDDLHPSGLDLEDVAFLNKDRVITVDEYGPKVSVFTKAGVLLATYVPANLANVYTAKNTGAPVYPVLPAIFSARQNGKGLESIAVNANSTHAYAYTCLEAPLSGQGIGFPTSLPTARAVRCLKLNVSDIHAPKVLSQKVVLLSDAAVEYTTQKRSVANVQTNVAITAASWISEDKVLLLEVAKSAAGFVSAVLRVADFATGEDIKDHVMYNNYTADASRVVGVTAVEAQKTLPFDAVETTKVFDFADVNFNSGILARLEGLAIAGSNTVIVAEDQGWGMDSVNYAGVHVLQLPKPIYSDVKADQCKLPWELRAMREASAPLTVSVTALVLCLVAALL